MKVSLVITTYNEEKNIGLLLDSIKNQTERPDEVVIVDSLSSDSTREIIESSGIKNLKLISEKCNIPGGRNLSIKKSSNEYILCTDSGCILDKDWIKEMKSCFVSGAEYVMGNFKTHYKGNIDKLIGIITLQTESRLGKDPYFASTKSIGFKKKIWSDIGGFDESLEFGEDTRFNIAAKERGYNAVFARDAIAYWIPRESLYLFSKQFFNYGYGDGISGNIFHRMINLIAMISLIVSLIISLYIILLETEYILFIFLLLLGYFLFNGLLYSLRYKEARYLFMAPLILILKRVSYFTGVFYGLIRRLV